MDGLKFSEHPRARAELRNTTIWYESKNDGLTGRFPMPWETRCKDILHWPRSVPVVMGAISELLLRSTFSQVEANHAQYVNPGPHVYREAMVR